MKLMNNTLNEKKEQPYKMREFWVFFYILSYQKPKFNAKLALSGKKMTLPEKCLWVFLSVLGNKALESMAITIHGNKTNFYEELAF